jgi:hypothetical protein
VVGLLMLMGGGWFVDVDGRWLVCFVDVGEIIDHHCLNLVFLSVCVLTDDDKYYIPETCKGKTGKSHYSTILPAVAPLTKDLEKCFKANEDYTAGNTN